MESLPLVFTRPEALAAGLSDKALRGPRVQRVLRGAYVRAGVELDLRVRALAALRLAPPGSVAARATAAVLLGGVVPHGTRVHMPSGQLPLPAVDARVRTARRAHAVVGGIPVTTAEDTFLDLAGELELVELVVLVDSLVRRGQSCGSPSSTTAPGRAGVAAARGTGARHERRVAPAPPHLVTRRGLGALVTYAARIAPVSARSGRSGQEPARSARRQGPAPI